VHDRAYIGSREAAGERYTQSLGGAAVGQVKC